jgi:hypothetical protein
VLNERNGTIETVGADEGVPASEVYVDEIMATRGTRLHTVSTFLRNENLDVYYQSVEGFTIGDVFLKMYAVLQSRVVIMGFVGGVYRKFTVGSWSDRTLGSDFERHSLQMISYLDHFYGYHRQLANSSKISVTLRFYMLQVINLDAGLRHFFHQAYMTYKSINHYSQIKTLILIVTVCARQILSKIKNALLKIIGI